MIEGAIVRLRSLSERDISVLHALRNQEIIQGQLLSRPRGSSLEKVKQWAIERCENRDSIFLIVSRLGDDQCVGFIQADKIDHVDQRCELGICLLDSEQGKGLGFDAIKAFLRYLRDTWNIGKVELRVRADNEKALSCYRKIGFSRCGTLHRHAFINGRWVDVVIMELFLKSVD